MTTVQVIEQVVQATVQSSAVSATVTEQVVSALIQETVQATVSTSEVSATASNVVVQATVSTSEVSAIVRDGMTDHGMLSGLADDDHTQYHTDARGDARYWSLSTDLATQAELDAHGHTFLGLTDTPDAYVGQALKLPRVNAGESALEFVSAGSVGVTDHGALTGLTDDDHPQYLLASGDTMTGPLKGDLYTGLKATLQGAAPPDNTVMFATDTKDFFVKVGGFWYKVPLFFKIDSPTPDMGYTQLSGISGYTDTYITDKALHNCRILGSALALDGSIRTQLGTFQVYLNSRWNTIPFNFDLREDSTGQYEFEHRPVGFTEWIEMFSGNGNTLGLNGLPIVQQYSVSIGAYPVQQTVDGGGF